MERVCGLAIGIPFRGRPFATLECDLYQDHRRWSTVGLRPCRIAPGRPTKVCRLGRWVRGESGFVRTGTIPEHDPYVWYGWEAPALRGGGCNGLDFPQGLAGHFRCRLLLRRTGALLEDLPLRWSVKTGMATPRGVVLGLRLVPPKAWSPVPVSSLQADTRHSSDGRFVIVHGRFLCALGAGTG